MDSSGHRVSRGIRLPVSMIRSMLQRLGYVLWKREFLVYGVLPFLDIFRLSRGWGRSVQTFFDVGANVGKTTEEALKEFPDARVFAFEPHPNTFKLLTAAVAGDRTSLHQLALGETSGEVKFYEYSDSLGDGRHLPGGGSVMDSLIPDARFAVKHGLTATTRTVECTTIDQFCESNKIERIDVLKIDTEGFDLFVIKGASRMLRERRVGFIYVEFNDLQPKPGTTGGSLIPISDYLTPFGFRYITTYTDYIDPDSSDIFLAQNALFALPGLGTDSR
jgi:FkbM family methyltransferase